MIKPPNLDAALKIDGWMQRVELEWLALKASSRSRIAEIGAWQGRTTVALADNTPGMVFAVDTWEGSEEHMAMLSEQPSDWLFGQFSKNVGDRSNIRAIRKLSVDAAKEIPDGSLDMIFIDAAHDYDNVKADILAWRPKLRPGGLFCGHDFDAGRVGVVKAVRELIGRPENPVGSIWVAS